LETPKAAKDTGTKANVFHPYVVNICAVCNKALSQTMLLVQYMVQKILPKANIFSPENGWLEDKPFPLGFRPIFRGYISFSEGKMIE